MLPKIFGISSYQLLNFCATLAMIIYISIFLKTKPKRHAIYIGIMCGVLGVIGARLLMAYEMNSFNWNTIFRDKYGMMDLGGAFLAVPIAMFLAHILFKVKYIDLFETIMEGLIIASAIAKLACFCSGCCGGISADVPWAINGRHPAQLYEVAVWVIMYIEVMLTKNEMNNINRICLLTIACVLMRMVVEQFRADANFFINGEYWVAYKILLVVSAVGLIINNRKQIKHLYNKIKIKIKGKNRKALPNGNE